MKTMDEFINELKENGFSVYTSDNKKEITYIHFVKDNKIGYCEYNYFGFYSFSTVHKPCREAGTGINVANEEIEPTIKLANDCLVHCPEWFIKKQQYIKKYKDWNEYINFPVNRILTYKQL